MRFPVRRKNGTPAHRQLSISSFKDTNVSVAESGFTPGSLRYPGAALPPTLPGPYWPRTTSCATVSTEKGRIDCSTLIFSLRTAVASTVAGGFLQTKDGRRHPWLRNLSH